MGTAGTGGTRSPLRRIVVAYDGSPAATRAARFALRFLSEEGAEVWLVHAASVPRSLAEPRTDEEQGAELRAIRESLSSIQASVDPTGQRLHFWVREGEPASVILAAAAEANADLIVLGTRGLRGASRVLLGSVSHAVVARSSRPVTVVP